MATKRHSATAIYRCAECGLSAHGYEIRYRHPLYSRRTVCLDCWERLYRERVEAQIQEARIGQTAMNAVYEATAAK